MLYCTIKRRTSLDPSTDSYALYRYEIEEKQFVSAANRRMPLGQLLCHIGCCNLDQWHYVSRTEINNFEITCYRYCLAGNEEDLIVVDYLGQGNSRSTDCVEEYSLENCKFGYDFAAEEFQIMYNLLIQKKAKLEDNLEEDIEAFEGVVHQYHIVANLVGRIGRDMDGWLRNNPQHPYSQWRMAELRNAIANNIDFFEYHKKENEND